MSRCDKRQKDMTDQMTVPMQPPKNVEKIRANKPNVVSPRKRARVSCPMKLGKKTSELDKTVRKSENSHSPYEVLVCSDADMTSEMNVRVIAFR